MPVACNGRKTGGVPGWDRSPPTGGAIVSGDEHARGGCQRQQPADGNEDLAEAICLAHDMGHPPFGHSGEAVLAKKMVNHGSFNHNRQTLRIVTKLEALLPLCERLK